ncbi:transposase [Microbulbifer sp. 2201CG32-9]|uniref:transposase n=1 Tax=Microbulbifer sp. 2201CG32-9 TaxID=3232309 RepID=UPI00345BBAC1
MKLAGRKVYLILENLRVYHSKFFKEGLNNHAEEIDVFHLPFCSLWLNPGEYLNCYFKTGAYGGNPAQERKSLNNKINSLMEMLHRKYRQFVTYLERKNN